MMSAAGSIRNKNDSAPAVPGPIVSSPEPTPFGLGLNTERRQASALP
jgi:hypothetical protein